MEAKYGPVVWKGRIEMSSLTIGTRPRSQKVEVRQFMSVKYCMVFYVIKHFPHNRFSFCVN